MNDLEIRRIVYGLLQAGLVEIVRPEGAPVATPATPPAHPAGSSNAESRSLLINRLISRIRSI